MATSGGRCLHPDLLLGLQFLLGAHFGVLSLNRFSFLMCSPNIFSSVPWTNESGYDFVWLRHRSLSPPPFNVHFFTGGFSFLFFLSFLHWSHVFCKCAEKIKLYSLFTLFGIFFDKVTFKKKYQGVVRNGKVKFRAIYLWWIGNRIGVLYHGPVSPAILIFFKLRQGVSKLPRWSWHCDLPASASQTVGIRGYMLLCSASMYFKGLFCNVLL